MLEGFKNCNVHNVSGPKCPWCDAKKSVVWLVDPRSVDLLMFIAYLIAALHQWRKAAVKQETKELLLDDAGQVDETTDAHKDKRFSICMRNILKRLWIPFAVFTIYDSII